MLTETFLSKTSTALSPEFHETFLRTLEQHLWFHGIPWNRSNRTSSSMEFHRILSRFKAPWNPMELFAYSQIPWNSMELLIFPQIPWNSMDYLLISMEFHRIPWKLINVILKKIIFLNIVVGIWMMIICCLDKISQKRYILHWFQYQSSYLEHPSVSENGTRSGKMACCYIHYISQHLWVNAGVFKKCGWAFKSQSSQKFHLA